MNKIVISLQEDALDPNSTVSAVLRKAYAVATKLNISELAEWCNKELKGYAGDEEKKPPYRFIHPVYRALNPYRGYIPVIIEDEAVRHVLSNQFVTESVAEIEVLASGDSDPLVFTINPELEQMFNQSGGPALEVKVFISKAMYVNILQSVRNIVLDWTLQLEKDGVIGTDLEFSPREKEMAGNQITNYGTIVYGSVNDSEIHHEISSSFNTETGISKEALMSLVDQIEATKSDSGLKKDDLEIVTSMLAEIRNEIKEEIPNTSRISSLFHSIKSVFENTVGSVIASGIIYEIDRIFPL